MRLGIITTRAEIFWRSDEGFLLRNGISCDYANRVGEFVERFGERRDYDGFLIHLPHNEYKTFLEYFGVNFPNKRFALVTHDLAESITVEEVGDGIPAFTYRDVEGIKKYFTRAD